MVGLVGSGANPFWGQKGQVGEGFEFGTSTGRQGTFDTSNLAHVRMALDRLKGLQGQYGDRLDPQFTGDTGLAPNDAEGYSTMLNARTEAMNIRRLLQGQPQMNTRYGGEMR